MTKQEKSIVKNKIIQKYMIQDSMEIGFTFHDFKMYCATRNITGFDLSPAPVFK